MKRQAWLDYIKCISMFIVIVYHTPPRFDPAREVALFYIGAPVFFFAAGYVFNISKYKGFFSFLAHRARQILVPYTTFFVVFYALWLAVGRRMAGPEEMAIDTLVPLKQFIMGMPDVVLGTFWFIVALFTIQIIYYPLRKYLNGWWPFVVALLLNLSLLILPYLPWFRLWNLDKAFLYLPIYAFGNCCRAALLDDTRQVLSKKTIADFFTFTTPVRSIMWVILAACGLSFLIIAPVAIRKDLSYILSPAAFILLLPCYCACSKWLESRLGTSRVVQTVAITGITYLALQNYLIGIIKMIVAKLAGPEIFDGNIALKLVIAFAVMVMIYPLALVIERYFPWMLGKKKSSVG